MIKRNGFNLSHSNRVDLVFPDMFKAYNYFMNQSLTNPNGWLWAKVDGRVLSYIAA